MRRLLLALPLLLVLSACGGSGNPLIPQLRPVEGGTITSGFGLREAHPVLGYVPGRHHDGYDIAVAAGSPVRASMDGDVVSAGWLGGYGNAVVLKHADGYTTLYGHAEALLVTVGQHVSRGDVIARVGSTGLSTGPHLHYELRKENVPVDPGGFDGEAVPHEPVIEALPASYREPAAPPVVKLRVAGLRADRPACEGGWRTRG